MDFRTFQRKAKDKVLYKLNLETRLRHWDDANYLKLLFFLRIGKRLNLDNPKTFNEKLQWLKLNYHRTEDADLVDKAKVKGWVAGKIGSEHVIPTLGVYNTFEEIDFDELPDSFILKATHDSGTYAICQSKQDFDVKNAKDKLQKSLKRTYFHGGREPHYKDLDPMIIAETLITDEASQQLRDYKFFCFNGEVKAVHVLSDRDTSYLKIDIFDRNFSRMNMRMEYPHAKALPRKPHKFEEMVELAEKLSHGMPHVRVDLYLANDEIYFGEMTFFPSSGMRKFYPSKWDKTWGDWLKLPDPMHG